MLTFPLSRFDKKLIKEFSERINKEKTPILTDEEVLRFKNIIDSIKNRNVDSSDSQYFSSYFDNEDVLNFYYDEDFTSGDYVVSEGDNLGKKQELVSIYELNMIDNNATISLTDKNDISLKEIEYKYLDESTG